jgi:predicted choloylglycine hydrolase
MKFEIGDLILVKGFAFFEKCSVVEIQKSTVTLTNGIKFNRKTLETLNSKCTIHKYDETEYEYLKAKSELQSILNKVKEEITRLSDNKDLIIQTHHKLSKLLNKLKSS